MLVKLPENVGYRSNLGVRKKNKFQRIMFALNESSFT